MPEIEAIATSLLVELENNGQKVVPCARAVKLTMDREGIRRLAAETLHLLTSPYQFVDDEAAFRKAAVEIGFPCIVKPVMSSSEKDKVLFVQSKISLVHGLILKKGKSRARARDC